MKPAPPLELTTIGEPLMDAPCGALLAGCEPGASVEVTCTTVVNGLAHASRATFVAGPDGVVDTTRQASLGGSYEGVDPFGLWWSAEPAPIAPTPAPAPPSAPVSSQVEARTKGATLTADLTRRWLAPGATAQPIDEGGIRGLFCRPAGPGPFPGVVAFGGSGGGLGPAGAWAPALASRGLAVLAVSYFGLPGLPAALVEIEVEVVERAAAWLLARADVRGPTIAVIGQSRGSELALLAGALLPMVRGVVGISASGVAWSGLDAGGPVDRPAWTFRGEPLPCAPIGAAASVAKTAGAAGPVALRPAFDDVMRSITLEHPAVIRTEAIAGPVLLISGRDDTMWPADAMSEIAVRRAAAFGRPDPITHEIHDDAGHMCAGVPGLPVIIQTLHPLTGGRYSFGGTRRGNARSRVSSWPRIVALLRGADLLLPLSP